MNLWKKSILTTSASLALLLIAGTCNAESAEAIVPTKADPVAETRSITDRIGVVNFRKVVEKSKLGKQQQNSFEGMKTQMESVLADKEKSLNEIAAKLNDADYLDGLTPDAENELKHKARLLNQEMAQAQQQFMQTLQQANMKIVQNLTEDVAKAAGEVAKQKKLDLVVNEESAFHYKPSLDISDLVVQKMDEAFDAEAKKKEVSDGKADPSKKLPEVRK